MGDFLDFRRGISAIAIAVLGFVLAMKGYHGYTVWLNEPAPSEMSLAEYIDRRPPAQWLRLTDCYVDYPHGVVGRNKKREVVEFDAPVWRNSGGNRHAVLVACEANPSKSRFFADGEVRTVEGVIRYNVFGKAIGSRFSDIGDWSLDKSYVEIDVDAKPQLKPAIISLTKARSCFSVVEFSPGVDRQHSTLEPN